MDIHCGVCGEPIDTYEFHDVAKERGLTYQEVYADFRKRGCIATGWGRECEPMEKSDDGLNVAEASAVIMEACGDDDDGAASMSEDLGIVAGWPPPAEPRRDARLPNRKPFRHYNEDAKRDKTILARWNEMMIAFETRVGAGMRAALSEFLGDASFMRLYAPCVELTTAASRDKAMARFMERYETLVREGTK